MKEVKLINMPEVCDYQNESSTKFLFLVDYNMAKVYELKDGNYLITPINPYYSSLIFSDLDSIKHYIKTENFPIKDKNDSFFIKNKKRIFNFLNLKKELNAELEEFIEYDENLFDLPTISTLCQTLFERKKLDSMKLNLVLLIGEYIINKTKNTSYKWFLHKRLGGINPVYFPVLYNESKKQYIELYDNLNDLINEGKKHKIYDMNFCIKMMLEFQKNNICNEIVPFDDFK